jgi:hypothetical protein
VRKRLARAKDQVEGVERMLCVVETPHQRRPRAFVRNATSGAAVWQASA